MFSVILLNLPLLTSAHHVNISTIFTTNWLISGACTINIKGIIAYSYGAILAVLFGLICSQAPSYARLTCRIQAKQSISEGHRLDFIASNLPFMVMPPYMNTSSRHLRWEIDSPVYNVRNIRLQQGLANLICIKTKSLQHNVRYIL